MRLATSWPLQRDRRRRSPLGRRHTIGHNLLVGLVDWWPLAEPAGWRIGVHGAHIMENNGAVGVGDGIGSLAATFQQSAGQHLTAADAAWNRVSGGSFCWAGWQLIGTKFDSNPIVGKWNYMAPQRSYTLNYERVADRFSFSTSDNGADSGGSVKRVAANNFGGASVGVWYFVAGWWDSVGQQIGISVNAGSPNVLSGVSTVADTGSAMRFGSFGATSFDFTHDGRLQRIGFWRRVLTADELTWLYNGGRGRGYPFV